MGRDDLRPWDSGEFQLPEDPREADGLDAGAVLEDLWDGWVPPDGGDLEERTWREPFTLQFPGLAPPGRSLLTPAERQRALDEVLPRIRESGQATPAARIGLIPASRPADVLALLGWQALADSPWELLALTAVLRSWEDRFGARLIDIGYADLRLLVDRPPRTLEAAQRIAVSP